MHSIFSGWNIMRLLRLVAGIIATIQAFQQSIWPLGITGIFVMLLAIVNLGCCGNAVCGTKYKNTNNKTEEIVYEELDK